MTRKVFIQIPSNQPSGGIKVANQLANLFKEHDYRAWVVLPENAYPADWLINPAPAINSKEMIKICQENDIIIDNWLDKKTIALTKKLKAKIKIFYSQGCTFYKSKTLVGDEHFKKDLGYTHFWTISQDSLNYLSQKYPLINKWYLVSPFFDFESAAQITAKTRRENKILAFRRKGLSYIMLAQLLYGLNVKFEIAHTFTEEEGHKLMASSKFFLSTAVGVNKQHLQNTLKCLRYGSNKYNISVIIPDKPREGFPLPPTEAAMCGCIVIGFAMGGGLEWMSNKTCFLAQDRSYSSLILQIKRALSATEKQLNQVKKEAFRAISKFNKENTWKQIEKFLSEV